MNVKKNEIDIFMNDIRKNYFKIPENYDFYDQKSSMIRLSALQDAVRAGKGHLGGSFSCIETDLLFCLSLTGNHGITSLNPALLSL